VKKSMTPHTEFTLWITPSEPLGLLLRSITRGLAARFDAVEFEPHVTVFCGPSTDEEARAVARRIASQFAPIELTADRLDHSERFTKTLFVQLHESARLRRMFEVASASFSRRSDYVLIPHLSLLYRKHPAAERRKLCDSLDLPMGQYGFDRIRMVETELPIEDDGPIRHWRELCDEQLLGPQ
jgi:2'-5' RNA ligase